MSLRQSDNDTLTELAIPPDLNLTGYIAKASTYPFESGGVADISLGSVINRREIKEQSVTIKIFRRIHIDGDWKETIRNLCSKFKAWSALDHPNVLRFLGTSLDLALSPALITPFCGSGSIMKYLTDTPRSSQERLGFVQGIARGLAYLHSQSIVHGNLTTRKILVSDAGLPVICGYGLANISSHLAKNTTTSSSKRFTAPEYLVDESTRRTTPGDVYSFSMVLLEVMSGVRPYDNIPHELNVVFHVLPGGRPSRSDNPRFVTDHFWRFLEGLWHHQPTLRPEMDHVILMLQSLQFDEHFDEERVNAVGRSSASPAVDRSDEEEVLFGHPSLSGFNPEDLRGRLFKTGDYPFATGGNLNLYRGYWEHRDGFKIRVAIKLVRVSNDGTGNPEELRRRLNREAEVWSSLNHRNLLPFLGVWDEHVTPLPALISPFYQSGDLKQYLTECPTADKENIILGVASGLEYLHRRDIVHGDLKVHNVLVDKLGRPCICDFGISKIVNSQGFTTSSVGTPRYMAPELFLILGELPTETFAPGPTTMSSDVYSFGLLALEILNPTLQYRPTEPILTLKAHGSLRPRRSDYSVPSDVWTLLDTCWEPDPSLRPTIRDVILRMPLDTSEARILTQFKNVPGLFLALESLRAIIQDCQKLAQNRHVAGQLSNRCHRLLLELREQYTDDGNMKSTILRVSECLVEIRAKMNVWASQGTTKIQGYLQAQNVERDIEFCHSLLSICSMESDLLPHLDIVEGIHLRLNADKDRQDVLDYLATIAHAQSISQDILAAQQSDLTQLMSMILQFQSGLQHSTHEQNLSILWNRLQDQNSDLTSNLYLRPGEVVRIGRYPISVTRGFDVYEGLYLLKKVTMRVMRALDSSGNNLRRFRHECDIWGKLWNADDGRHILPFYGFCEDDGPLPYMVAPWMSNGTSLEYVRTGDGIDHMKLIKGIASGIEVLHTLSPSIIHGDIKGDNILIDDEGNPLIFNFGLSKFAEGTATDILFPSNQSGSASWQWLAPEASLGSGPSLASDIYSYGMTVLELLTHDKPWNIKNPSQVLIRAAQGEIPPRPMQPDVLQRGLDDNLWALLKCCWALQPEERPTIHKLLSTLSLL